jgi:glutathione S-transferase
VQLIFHVTAAADWHDAEATGAYRLSTRGRTLEDEGFIHCSYANQVTPVANAYYHAVRGLVLLVIERDRVTAPLRDESPAGGDERFPHIYGPLNLDAVTQVLPFESSSDGLFSLPEPWRTSAQ